MAIGYGNRSIKNFSELLDQHGIQLVADVRSFPTSKIEHFKRERMEKWLPEYGIEYVWLGKELGGYRRGGYRRHMRTELSREGINRLLEIAETKRACIMCMEAKPKYCHRRFISHILKEKASK